ncbi:MAG: ABC transporter ATP-binding protein [Xanthomonadaceae bacterium]|nr:ABC transporter ATP-binding protein [Xanthomonadaceae bacterium]MDP2186483.1 ABC transporter ATP-binding protein [Xanthomonadales bacterium]MDZ4117403.1 ABC transporter ATP-binding protein [Xanthomonadaceae bacterium]MDZ4379607.1 ABC transporter ATP-binding protein [Xanthomonadaceae bacterium]
MSIPASSPIKPAIEVRGVSKTYRMWATPAARLWVPLLYRAARACQSVFPALARRLNAAAMRRLHTHQALSDIDLTLMPGESLGIIGLNGSGKSTLLQIIAGVLPPSSGTVRVHGRVAALLELGSGFNPDMTGRENVYINAAILGFERRRVDTLIDQIIAFAEIGDYIDEPVRTYSSGMVLRLAFAVQVHVEPDVLIVDEALSVGDAQFQAKAMTRIEEILANGTTLLFVGHDLNALRAFCQHAMLLEKGRVVLQGLPEDVITAYLQDIQRGVLRARGRDASALVSVADGFAHGKTRVLEAHFENGGNHCTLRFAEPVSVHLALSLDAGIGVPGIIVDVLDLKGLQVSGRRIALPASPHGGMLNLRLQISAALQKGVYRIRTRIVDAPSLEQTVVLARHDGGLSFEVIDDSRHRFTGLFELPMQVDILP